MMDVDIEKLVSNLDFESGELKQVGKIQLTNKEIDILNQYHIPYQNCQSLKEVLYEIEAVLDDMDIVDEELELISESISERDYYQNTNK